MTVSTLRRIASLSSLLISVGLVPSASAGSMFTVTNLGSGYTLQEDASGTVHSVTSGDGGRAYAFEKSPTTSIDVRYTSHGVMDSLPRLGQWYFGGLHSGGYVQHTLQNGELTGGYFSEEVSGAGVTYHVPFGFSLGNTWHNQQMSPVADMNAQGQIVGTSEIGATAYYGGPAYLGGPTYAAFSAATGGTHDPNNLASVVDNLNNYIDSSLGINLTQGLKVDDLGRIIAQGTVDGQTRDFLLTPEDLPTLAPEPSTLALLAVGVALAARSAHGRRRRINSDS